MFALVERHRSALGEWLTWIDATRTLGDARRYAQFAQVQFESRVAFDYTIRAENEIVGAIGIHGIDWAHRSAQIGYWVSPEASGRGIATRAADAMTSIGFAHHDVHRLEIRCVVENTRSRAVAERLGFAYEGTLRDAYFLHGRYRDISLYGMTAGTWPARRGKRAALRPLESTRDVILQSARLEEAVRFYRDVLGFAPTLVSDEIAGFETGRFQLFVERGSSPGPVFEIECDEFDGAKARLLEHGCTVVDDNPEIPRCYLRDPFGLVFNLSAR